MKQVTFDITTTITHSLTHDQQNMNKVIIEMVHKVNTYVSQDMNIIIEMFHMFNGKTKSLKCFISV
jgi:flavoprotein